jgi:hypothetical protein
MLEDSNEFDAESNRSQSQNRGRSEPLDTASDCI